MHETIRDIVCQVLVDGKSSAVVYDVLSQFLPQYEKLAGDYAGKPDDEEYVFASEVEMVNFYTETPNVRQTFYWNQRSENPHNIMVGANITRDNQTVFSLTLDGT